MLKKLHCPYGKQWSEFEDTNDFNSKYCSICEKKIYDTSFLEENEVIALIKADSNVCLKIDLDDSKFTIGYEK